MRALADAERIRRLAEQLGKVARAPATLYLTGGATAVLEGWRASTVDVDIRIEPDTDDIFRALARIKDQLDLNIELASPPDFIPELPGWRERSPFVLSAGALTVRHFDPYSQALSKIERGLEHDLADVREMLARDLIHVPRALELFATIEPRLHRYPAIDPTSFRAKVGRALGPT